MNTILAALLSFLLLYKYIALFIIIFFSALILPLPDNTVLLATGAFISQGYFSFWLSLLTVILGNVAGDCVGYFVARRYGKSALQRLHIRVPWYIDRVEKYIHIHPRSTIFLTRFVGSADSIANVLAGFGGMAFSTFIIWDIIGNFFSLSYIMYIGYFLGIYWMNFSGILSIIGLICFVLVAIAVIAIIAGYRPQFFRKIRK